MVGIPRTIPWIGLIITKVTGVIPTKATTVPTSVMMTKNTPIVMKSVTFSFSRLGD